MKLSERIKKYRQEHNLTQEQFASMLFVSKQAVSKWENDRGMPDVSLYPELAKILNVTIDELMGLENKEIVIPKTEPNKKKINKKLFIILGIILLIVIFVIVMISTKEIRWQNRLYKKAESLTTYNLPSVDKFNYADLSTMPAVNNLYPTNIYYFVFEEDTMTYIFENQIYSDSKWKSTLDSNVPYYLEVFLDTSDLFLIIETKENSFVFLAYQEQIHRLIISEYEWRELNE